MNSNLKNWFESQPKWQQYAVKTLFNSGEINEDNFNKIVELCQKEATGEFPDIDCSIPTGDFDTHDSEKNPLVFYR